jgi:hypothetical protein
MSVEFDMLAHLHSIAKDKPLLLTDMRKAEVALYEWHNSAKQKYQITKKAL